MDDWVHKWARVNGASRHLAHIAVEGKPDYWSSPGSPSVVPSTFASVLHTDSDRQVWLPAAASSEGTAQYGPVLQDVRVLCEIRAGAIPPDPKKQARSPPISAWYLQGSQSLVRVKLPSCFMPSRVVFLEDPEFNREWMTESISEPESMELAAIWLILRLRANQTVDPGLAAPAWYPAQLLGYSNKTLTDRFDYLRQQALREPPSTNQPYMLLDCYVKEHQRESCPGRLLRRELQPNSQELVVQKHHNPSKVAWGQHGRTNDLVFPFQQVGQHVHNVKDPQLAYASGS